MDTVENCLILFPITGLIGENRKLRNIIRMATNIVTLPDDDLFLIFSYCDVQTLGRLSCVCRTFNRLINKASVWLSYSKLLTLMKDKTRNRKHECVTTCMPSLKERCRIYWNWSDGRFHDTVVVRHSRKQIPWIQFQDRDLWISTRNHIQCYKVHQNGFLYEDYSRKLRGPKDDVTKFCSKDGLTVCGIRDGSVCGWDNESGNLLFHYHKINRSDTQAVDFYRDILISGSRDATVKILSMADCEIKHNNNQILKTLKAGDRVWSLAVAPDGSSFASGSGGCFEESPLALWDLVTGSLICPLGTAHRRGAGVLDIKYENPQTMLTCGYDTYLRLWDKRTQSCVAKWCEPFDSAIYCLDTDHHMSIITGTARYGMTRLWDMRKKLPVQMFYAGQHNSPVYSLAFNSRHLYVALDLGLNLLNFTKY